MSQTALDAFEEVRREMLDTARVCAWCDKTCTSSDALVQHIWETHPKNDAEKVQFAANLELLRNAGRYTPDETEADLLRLEREETI